MLKKKTNIDRDKYNDKIFTVVKDCIDDLFDLAVKHKIEQITFKNHNIDIPHATFNDDKGIIKWSPVTKVEFGKEMILIRSEDQTAYLDTHYGDYFDVAQSLPQIFAAVVDCIEEGLLDEEKTGSCINTYQIKNGKEPVPSGVSCKITEGIGVHLVGLQDKDVKESLLRVATALTSLGYSIPGKKVVISVSPNITSGAVASLLDAPIALAILAEMGKYSIDDECCIVGELGLDGSARFNPVIEEITAFHKEMGNGELIISGDETMATTNVRTFDSLRNLLSM